MKAETAQEVRVLLARSLLEAHDLGLRMVAARCRNAGIEVIYSRFGQIEEMARAAEQEDVQLIGVTVSSGNHLYIAAELLKLLKEKGLSLPLILGGVIPTRDVPPLLEMGVAKVFGPGSMPDDAAKAILELTARRG